MITRRTLEKTKDLLTRFPAVVLVGPRQVGKTTLAMACAENNDGIYLDLESQKDLRKLSDPEDYLSKREDNLIVLDEIQRVPKLFEPLRGLIDSGKRKGKKSGRFLLLGSASLDLFQHSSETLAGRIAYQELCPLDASEVKASDLDKLWFRGGFPDSFLTKNDTASAEYRDFLIRSYLERDVPLNGGRLAAGTLRALWTMLAHCQGGIENISSLSKNLAINSRTVSSHLDLLENMLLLRKLLPWHKNAGKRLVKAPKLYIRDSGLVHELLGISHREALAGHPVIGASWEGFVIENLLSCAPVRTNPFYYRSSGGAEIDLILEFRDGKKWAIEIKRGLSPDVSKGFNFAKADIKPTKSFVVYGGDDRYKLKDDIEATSLHLLQAELLKMK